MSELLSSAFIGLSGILAGAIATYLTTRSRIRKELAADYEKSLRDARISVYRDLWKELQPLAKYSRPGPVTYETVQQLSDSARQWYFEIGGLYLSENARDAYFALMDEYAAILAGQELPDVLHNALSVRKLDWAPPLGG